MTRGIASYRRELSVAGVYALVLVAMRLIAPQFFHGEFRETWIQSAPVLVAAAGMTLVIVARQIDISIGSQFSICGVAAGLLAKAGLPMPAVAGLTIGIGVLMGAFNGLLVAFLELPSIIVTLATFVILREALRWVREGEAVRDLPGNFQWFGCRQRTGEWLLIAIALGVVALIGWSAKYLAAGRTVYAVGSDADAARLAGIRPKRVTFNVFALMGGLVGLAALLNAVRFPQVDVNAGNGLELEVIAAVVVGGTAISGGR
ncbi:MAG: ABC transporter permease, partial [Tepidisphaeraceae bacterium]